MSNDLCNISFILILMKFCSFKRPMKFFIHFVIWHKHEEKVDEINCSWQLHWSCYLSVNMIKVSNCYFVSTKSKYIVHLLLVIIWLKVFAALSFFCCGFFSNPHYGDHFSGTIHLDQSLEQKLWKKL